jgi:hypothetical protein
MGREVGRTSTGQRSDAQMIPAKVRAAMARLAPGEPFPEVTVQATDGPVELRERWRGGPLVVAFMRHFG